MATKIDGKVIIAKLEFAAKAAEEFLKAYNLVKAEIEEIKPLTPYAIKKQERDQRMQRFSIEIKQHHENKIAREQEKIKETMQTNGMSWSEAVNLMATERSNIAKRNWVARRKNAKTKDFEKK